MDRTARTPVTYREALAKKKDIIRRLRCTIADVDRDAACAKVLCDQALADKEALQKHVQDLEMQLRAARRELDRRDDMIRAFSRGIRAMCK
jgi:hypothetical protein